MQQSSSFSQNAGRRLKKNKGAMVGLMIICLSILIGCFAYFLGTDSTPNADRQIVEIQARKPGYTQLLFKVKKERQIPATGFFHRLLFGVEDKYLYVPINRFAEKDDSVYVEIYIDEDLQERQAFAKNSLSTKNYIVSKTFWLGTDKFGRDILSR
ncbi:MAG: ABC transporter permease, partial [Ginsengibacter sp.]